MDSCLNIRIENVKAYSTCKCICSGVAVLTANSTGHGPTGCVYVELKHTVFWLTSYLLPHKLDLKYLQPLNLSDNKTKSITESP